MSFKNKITFLCYFGLIICATLLILTLKREYISLIECADLDFSLSSGIYDTELNIQLFIHNTQYPPKGKVYYTLDGKIPDHFSTEYNGEIILPYNETEIKVYPLTIGYVHNGSWQYQFNDVVS